MTRIAVAEDNNFLAATIQEKIELFPDSLKFKYRAVNGSQMLDKLETDSNVDVILMDIQMPQMNGIDATAVISKKYPQIKIIMLTVLDDENHIFQAISAGANGYILKDVPPPKLLDGINEIMDGGAPMSAEIASKALRILRNPELLSPEVTEDFNLSKRELDVLVQLSSGLDYKQISENLIISPGTVRKHIENIYGKLHVHNKMEAVQKAQKNKLI